MLLTIGCEANSNEFENQLWLEVSWIHMRSGKAVKHLFTSVIQASATCTPRHLDVFPRRDPAECLTIKLSGLMENDRLGWHVQTCRERLCCEQHLWPHDLSKLYHSGSPALCLDILTADHLRDFAPFKSRCLMQDDEGLLQACAIVQREGSIDNASRLDDPTRCPIFKTHHHWLAHHEGEALQTYLDEAILEKQLNDLLEKRQQAGVMNANAPLQKGQGSRNLWQSAVIGAQAIHSRIEDSCDLRSKVELR